MINRELGIQEIYERIKLVHEEIGVTSFNRTPSEQLRDEDFPYIIIEESTDSVIDHSKRNAHGYPAKRVAEIILEIGINDDDLDDGTDIRKLYGDVRKAIFTVRGSDPVEYSPVLLKDVFIRENRTEGPMGVNIPNMLVMRLVLDLVYNDKAFLEG